MGGRRLTTGRFATREELVYWVRRWYYNTGMNQAQVARACRVSSATVRNILNRKPKGATNELQA